MTDSPIWIQLSRTGDLMNLFPLFYQDHLKGNRRTLMVSAEFSGVTEGCSYFDTMIFHGPSYDIPNAVLEAEKTGRKWICTQVNANAETVAKYVYGPASMDKAATTSFQKEMWKIAGRLKEWDNCYPLVFDQRNKEREEKLLKQYGFGSRGRRKPLMLVSLEGASSPFPYKDLLLELLRGRFPQYRIAPVPRCERIFDLLALYECAEVLVAIDSAPLHLAWAVPKLPVIVLANDKPMLWHGSSWKPNHHFYCRYSDFPQRAIELLDSIKTIPTAIVKSAAVIHVWSEYQNRRTVEDDLLWLTLPINSGMCGRDTGMIPDPKRAPYLKDCIRMALQKDCEFVCLTQPDTILEEDAINVVKHDACFAYRMVEVDGLKTFHPTVDLFCASKEWWRFHLGEIPDYILGRDMWWTHGLRGLFSKHGAVDVTGIIYKVPSVAKDAPTHPPLPPRIKINKDLAEKYISDHHIYCRYPKVSEQVEMVKSWAGMMDNAYNPTIVEHKGKILMACRYHPSDTPATSLILVELNQDFSVVKSEPIWLPCSSAEDPKFFLFNDEVHMSWVESTWPSIPPKSVVKYSKLMPDVVRKLEDNRPELPGNDGTTMQKNYVFFEYEKTLHCIYQLQPNRIFKSGWSELKSDCHPTWSYGAIRGGTQPVPYDGKWLRFFHGHLDNDFGQYNRRYYMGALLMEPKPPFNVIRVSKKPIVYGSELGNLKVSLRPHHFKANVIFPGGVIERKDHWLVSVGINDCESAILKINPKELNL